MYNPSEPGKKGTLFGLPYSLDEAALVFLPVHLDATVSYLEGTAKSPDLIREESSQLDLSLTLINKPWELKMTMIDRVISESQNEIYRERARNVISALEGGKKPDNEQVQFVNEFCKQVATDIEELAQRHIAQGKLVAIIGGDHSSPLGLINSLASKYEYGILQIDAHMDLRESYEGFTYSHASIMYNALMNDSIINLTQVGIRDFCEEEEEFVRTQEERVCVFFDEEVYKARLSGKTWLNQCKRIVDQLPPLVYISFDMDGLDPSLCPRTGTPVPGGLSFNEANVLIEELVRSGRKIIGFDVCETGPHTWDANVASRIIYRLATFTGVANGLLNFKKS